MSLRGGFRCTRGNTGFAAHLTNVHGDRMSASFSRRHTIRLPYDGHPLHMLLPSSCAHCDAAFGKTHTHLHLYTHECIFCSQVKEATPALEAFMGSAGGLAVSVWTTTPWTLPANLAVAVSETIEYSVVEHASLGDR